MKSVKNSFVCFKAEKEAEHVNITAQQDRKYYMECTIVRIMKTRKVLKHAALINEVGHFPGILALNFFRNQDRQRRFPGRVVHSSTGEAVVIAVVC